MPITIGALISAHRARVTNGMLSRAIQSVLDQTRCVDALSVWVDKDLRGAAYSKQQALEMLNTDFVAVLDSDDIWLPDHLMVLQNAQWESKADLVYSWFETDPPGMDPFPPSFFSDPWDPARPRHTTTTVMARTKMMKQVGYSEASDGVYADDDWRMTCGLIELGATIHHVPARTWIWNLHGQGSSGRPGQGDAR